MLKPNLILQPDDPSPFSTHHQVCSGALTAESQGQRIYLREDPFAATSRWAVVDGANLYITPTGDDSGDQVDHRIAASPRPQGGPTTNNAIFKPLMCR